MTMVDALHEKLGLHGPSETLHLSIGLTAILVFALIASVLLVFTYLTKVDTDRGIFSFFKFIYANVLKPHDADATGNGGQQHALESFYKTQVIPFIH
jgi:hypothetical protein